MDNDLIETRQLLVPVLMKITYKELTLQHNFAGFILPTERYEQIYKKGAYAIPPVIPLYDDNIDKDATRLEINRSEGKHEARRNNRQLYHCGQTNEQRFNRNPATPRTCLDEDYIRRVYTTTKSCGGYFTYQTL